MQFEWNGEVFKQGDSISLETNRNVPVEGLLYFSGHSIYIASDNPGADGGNAVPDGYPHYGWCFGGLESDGTVEFYDNDITEGSLRHIGKLAPIQQPNERRIKVCHAPKAKDQATALKHAIDFIKTCPYKGTAIKVEFEGQLDRGSSEDDCEEFLCARVPAAVLHRTIYKRFYDDGSVDSEFTFTVPIDHPEDVLSWMRAWNRLVKREGNGCDTSGAGMHIAILNSTSGSYPGGNSLNPTCHRNFQRALTSLQPALFFLASCDYHSRELYFRQPKVATDKYSAIHSGSLYEFRCFETCYQRPEAFYDYLIVIANSLRFYSETPVLPYFCGKIGKLGMPDGDGVGRFYYSYDHVRALNLGLRLLKPSYKTIEQLYAERNFRVDVAKLKAKDDALTIEWRKEHLKAREAYQKAKQEKLPEVPFSEYRQHYQYALDRWLGAHNDMQLRPERYDQATKEKILQAKALFDKGDDESIETIIHKIDRNTSFADYKAYRLRELSKAVPKRPAPLHAYLKQRKQSFLTNGVVVAV